MKIFYIAIFCLCTISAYSQTTIAKDAGQKTNGSYSFLNATVAIRNNKTKADVAVRTFSDTTALKGLNELSLPVQPVFLAVHIQSGMLTACILWNNLKEYTVVDGGTLLLPAGESYTGVDPQKEDFSYLPYRLSPLYSLLIEGNMATFTFRELYGNSRYDFTLESTVTITLIRDEPYNKTL